MPFFRQEGRENTMDRGGGFFAHNLLNLIAKCRVLPRFHRHLWPRRQCAASSVEAGTGEPMPEFRAKRRQAAGNRRNVHRKTGDEPKLRLFLFIITSANCDTYRIMQAERGSRRQGRFVQTNPNAGYSDFERATVRFDRRRRTGDRGGGAACLRPCLSPPTPLSALRGDEDLRRRILLHLLCERRTCGVARLDCLAQRSSAPNSQKLCRAHFSGWRLQKQ